MLFGAMAVRDGSLIRVVLVSHNWWTSAVVFRQSNLYALSIVLLDFLRTTLM